VSFSIKTTSGCRPVNAVGTLVGCVSLLCIILFGVAKPMKLFQARIALMALLGFFVAVATSGCGAVNGLRAKSALNDGARAYKAGDFDEAEQHFRRALELNPEQQNAPFFIARSIHAQYRPGAEDPTNVARAREAIAAYQKVLDNNPNNDEAYNAMVYLYRSLKDEQKEREFLEARATRQDSPPEKRSQALTVLASKQWNCSFGITEQKDVKATATENGKSVVKYKKPANEQDFERAKKCVTEGLKLAEQAISLDANSEQAWSYKTNLLLEAVKLAEMDGNAEARAEYQTQAGAAQQRTAQLNEINKQRREEEEKAKAAEKAAS